MNAFANTTAVVTGANGGLGKALVAELLARDAKIVATDLRDDQLKELARNRNFVGFVKADIQTCEGCAGLYRSVKQVAPRIDALFNVAACAVWGKFQDVSIEDTGRTLAVDLLAPIWLTKLFLPDFLQQGSGLVANVSSLLGCTGAGKLSAYCASKHGLRGFTESLFGDLAGTNVQVTTLYPVGMQTPIFERNSTARRGERHLRPPDLFLQDPRFVAREFLRGIEKKRLHVYTRPYGLPVAVLSSLVPARLFLPVLNRAFDTLGTRIKA
jgi:short-subunit dehydrogenase